MAKANFWPCLKVSLTHEGGWADHPHDPGGATMKGITLATFRRFKPGASKADLRRISDEDVQRIYRVGYWNPISGDKLAYGVDLAVLDYGINSGPARAARYLQAVVGVKQDGVIGPQTLKAAVMTGGKSVIQKLCAKRLAFVQGLKTWKHFGRGWSRRIADVEAKAVAMWLTKGKRATEAARAEMEADAKAAEKKAKAQDTGAGGAAAGGGGAVVTAEPNWMLLAGVAVLVVAGVVLFIKARQNKDRSQAYRAAASAL